MKDLDKVYEYVQKEEDRHYDLAFKEFERNNITGNMIMSARAGAFQQVRYFIEMLEEDK